MLAHFGPIFPGVYGDFPIYSQILFISGFLNHSFKNFLYYYVLFPSSGLTMCVLFSLPSLLKFLLAFPPSF